jgi:hypothetical protein
MKHCNLLILFAASLVCSIFSLECNAAIPHTQGDHVFVTTTLATGDKNISTGLGDTNNYPSLFISGESNSTIADVIVSVHVEAYYSNQTYLEATRAITIRRNNSGYDTIPLQFTQTYGTPAYWNVTYSVTSAPANTTITMEAYCTSGL